MLNNFVEKIEKFFELPHSEQITIFAYFLIIENKQEVFTANEIKDCYNQLLIPPYSNISAYINKNISGREAKFQKKRNGFIVTQKTVKTIASLIGKVPERKPTNDLIDLVLFNNTRDYLKRIFVEACRCYDEMLFTSSLVMLRKGIEVLIIDLYEKRTERNKIVNKSNQYYFLSDLIDVLKNDTDIKLGRNTPKALDGIKKYGDLSAHGRFWALKSDIDARKEDTRNVVGELLNMVDYPNWKN